MNKDMIPHVLWVLCVITAVGVICVTADGCDRRETDAKLEMVKAGIAIQDARCIVSPTTCRIPRKD